MNSFTSRPRSPIKPTTIISASVYLAIIPNSTDFPTPDPANKPIRCPRPTVNKALIARTPTSNGFSIGARSIGLNGLLNSERESDVFKKPIPSNGLPIPSTTRPNNSSPTGSCFDEFGCKFSVLCLLPSLNGDAGFSKGSTLDPGANPETSSEGIKYN